MLKHLWSSGSTWNEETLPIQASGAFNGGSMVLDPAGAVHVCTPNTSGIATYLDNVGGSWSSETVSSNAANACWIGAVEPEVRVLADGIQHRLASCP